MSQAYRPNNLPAASLGSTINGLNQPTNVGVPTTSFDGRGNMTSDGTRSYGYDVANRLTSTTGATLDYDLDSRLSKITGGSTTRFGYDGVDLIGEYDSGGTLLRRYVHGPGSDEPLVWYEVFGSTKRWMVADDLGSVIALTTDDGVATQLNRYDEYGRFDGFNTGRFQYTGQTFIPELGVYYYKARMYSPSIGRFLQTDPAGYEYGLNLYWYVGDDPINFRDPTGLRQDSEVSAVEVCGPCARGNIYFGTGLAQFLKKATRVVTDKACALLPDGRTLGASGMLGGFVGAGGGVETVVNYNTNELVVFRYATSQVGWNGGVSGSVNLGLVWGMKKSSDYSGHSTGVAFPVAPAIGAYAAGNPKAPINGAKTAGVNLGASGPVGAKFTGGITNSYYSQPKVVGTAMNGNQVDFTILMAKQTICRDKQ